MTVTTFTTFRAAAKAIVAGELPPICAQVIMFSDLLGRDVTYTGHHIKADGCVEFKPDSARLHWQIEAP